MAAKLAVWNGTLDELGHRPLADTGEAVEAGRTLTRHWDRVVAYCLSQASWNFAMETIRADADTGVTPNFGFTEVFAKPSDWVRTYAISQDERFAAPLLDYYDDVSFWSAESTPIYVRYVSSDTGLGLALDRWPIAFTRFVELELAERACLKLTQNGQLKQGLQKDRDRARREAKNQDAMNEPNPKFPPPNGWTLSRGGRMGRNDRGSRGSLTG